MKRDEIDRILGEEPPVIPSSGFSASVMDAVRSQAEGAGPLRFPWLRVVPGLVVCGIAIVAALVNALAKPAAVAASWSGLTDQLQHALYAQTALLLAATLFGSWIVVRLSLIVAGFER